jgi:hypothetical protein
VIFTANHSNVFYIYKKSNDFAGFEAVEKARAVKNDFGLDLFVYDKGVYEGRTGCRFIYESDIPNLADKVQANGGIEKLTEKIETLLKTTGDSPRYTRPDERKQDIFPPPPPDPIKENTIFAKDTFGNKHYYFRFYNETCVQLYNLKNEHDSYRRVFIECDGFMVDIGQQQNLEERLKWLAGLENGIRGEIEKRFNEQMANPKLWADPGFANVLGRTDEAETHNAPIREARELEYEKNRAEREAKRIAEEQAKKAAYEQAIKTAEEKILNKETVLNADINGKSLIMQLFREHNISIPLKTQGWIINALHDIHYDENRERWSYQYYNKSKDSTVFFDYLPLLVSTVQTKQQFEEMNQRGDEAPDYDTHVESENENDMAI